MMMMVFVCVLVQLCLERGRGRGSWCVFCCFKMGEIDKEIKEEQPLSSVSGILLTS